MIRGLPRAATLLFASVGWLSGCASPRENLYTLESPATQSTPAADERATVAVGPVTVPDLVDRPQLVVRDGRYGVTIAEQERWAAPLKESLPRVFATELARLRPERRFVAYSAAALDAPAARLLIDVTSFDVSRDAGAVVVAHWSYRAAAKGSRLEGGDLSARAAVTNTGYAGYVDALHRASQDLAAQLAAGLAPP